MLAVVVETGDLLSTVIASAIAGAGVTAVFSVAIWGGARFADLSREGRSLAAAGSVALAAVALLTTLAAVAFGIFVMTSK